MLVNAAPVTNHRLREQGYLVYPVISRRSRGLSVGINLFPKKKMCNFNCPYCEVFPFSCGDASDSAKDFSLPQMEDELRSVILKAKNEQTFIRDFCFSGNGEPALSVDFPNALKKAAALRDELADGASIVLITNGTGLLQPDIFNLLKEAVKEINLDIWLKLDAASAEWYKKINRSSVPIKKLTNKIKDFAACTPVTIQTMLCAINGSPPSEEETQQWQKLVQELSAAGNIKKVQIYGKVRPAPEDPLAEAVPVKFLEERAELIRGFVNVEVYP